MASGASSTDGAVYASLGHVSLIILAAVPLAILITLGMGKLHRIANPVARTEKDGILLLRLKMLAQWPIEYLSIGWTEMVGHRWVITRKRYKPRHAK